MCLFLTILTGHDRFQRALKAAGHAAFDAEEFGRWRTGMKERWGDGDKPGRPFMAEGEADEHEKVFRERVKWWEG